MDQHPPLAIETVPGSTASATGSPWRRGGPRGSVPTPSRSTARTVLLHEFLSRCRIRADEYGGSLENRMRFPLEVFDAVRAAFPPERPVSMRVSGTDWAGGGWDLEQTMAFAQALEARGCGAVHVSSGGLTPAQRIPMGPSYQVPMARAVKAATRLPTVAVGLITEFEQAEARRHRGRRLRGDRAATSLRPAWPWHAAAHSGPASRRRTSTCAPAVALPRPVTPVSAEARAGSELGGALGLALLGAQPRVQARGDASSRREDHVDCREAGHGEGGPFARKTTPAG